MVPPMTDLPWFPFYATQFRNSRLRDLTAANDAGNITAEALVRIPGESKGADEEVAFANTLGIPTFFPVEGFLRWAKGD